ncbi:hypothetical protein PGTUg99_014140 [Puccinia graminis f. sp. tritici]|uniref:Uncharacterized protein n=1 Tax=Puccinia graminis f. sp. tritici TaxID=56615 RepID=A0A5B0REV7_PUCGR|nr:hypothetical protein PGTUg99_014140 [Puccinia graminis f. sp. tritici]
MLQKDACPYLSLSVTGTSYHFQPHSPYSTSTVHKLRQQTTSLISVSIQHSDISHQPLDSSYPLSKPSSHIFDRTMGGGNGAKAAQKRERNAKASGATAKSQLKVNEAAKNIQCKVCFQTFLITSREPALKEHAENRHSKALLDCFPMWKP